jgi:hypothetical protein
VPLFSKHGEMDVDSVLVCGKVQTTALRHWEAAKAKALAEGLTPKKLVMPFVITDQARGDTLQYVDPTEWCLSTRPEDSFACSPWFAAGQTFDEDLLLPALVESYAQPGFLDIIFQVCSAAVPWPFVTRALPLALSAACLRCVGFSAWRLAGWLLSCYPPSALFSFVESPWLTLVRAIVSLLTRR